MLDQALTILLEFLPIYAACYAVNVFLYFATGWVLVKIQDRHPERRIQQNRRGEKRMWKEIRASVYSLTVTAGCLAGGIFLSMKGWTLVAPLELTWWSAILMFVVSILAFDTWFYWGHRFMHTKAMYR
ncbi:MAG: fatty acid hydroxylase family protein, partial [Roseibium sp.]|nr:fatty acid hydroxylase family protein [Roseibium sp.]